MICLACGLRVERAGFRRPAPHQCPHGKACEVTSHAANPGTLRPYIGCPECAVAPSFDTSNIEPWSEAR